MLSSDTYASADIDVLNIDCVSTDWANVRDALLNFLSMQLYNFIQLYGVSHSKMVQVVVSYYNKIIGQFQPIPRGNTCCVYLLSISNIFILHSSSELKPHIHLDEKNVPDLFIELFHALHNTCITQYTLHALHNTIQISV